MENEVGLVSDHDDDRDEVERICVNRFPEWLGDAKAEAASSVLHACEQIQESVVGAGWDVGIEVRRRPAFDPVGGSDSPAPSVVHVDLEGELDCSRTQDGEEHGWTEE
jgi:hypothetical protein